MRQNEITLRLATILLVLFVCFTIIGCSPMRQSDSPSGHFTSTATAVSITPSVAQVRSGSTLQFTASLSSSGVTTQGSWSVSGGEAYGSISSSGLYSAPASAPIYPTAQVLFEYNGVSTGSQITLLNPLPELLTLSPDSSSTSTTAITASGAGFIPGSTLLCDGTPIQTTFVDSSHLMGTIVTPSTAKAVLQVQVYNPDPGAESSSILPFNFAPSPMTVSPTSISAGQVTLTASVLGVSQGSLLLLNGVPLSTVSVSNGTITASGFLPPWISGDVPISVTAPDGSTMLAQAVESVTPMAVSFDTAARFSTQAAWGPRPDVVMHIQQVGLQAFLNEQFAAPVGQYDVTTTNPIRSFFLNITQGDSLLRLRVAWAFQTFIPGQTFFSNHNLALPWEQLLERDAFSNYRQILLDAASDPNITSLLNLAGNAATNNPDVHPNQNFAREVMQLFSTGTVMLNDDGSPTLDAQSHTIPAYDDNTVIDMSRALTGWNYGTPQNGWFTGLFNIDFSVPLVANENQHDQGSKTLFGSVVLPAGQSAAQDRDAAIEAIMNHPNTAPFVSRLLIQRLVKSAPSGAYVRRIAEVFKDDGNGVKGNLVAVISAILLDPEARTGDAAPNQSDGFLQDPLYQQMFAMSVLQISSEDDQSTYIFNAFSEAFWNPGTVFAYFSPSYVIPGSTVNSPEFQLLTNFTDIQRSQFLLSLVTGHQPGFNNGFNGWLYQNFTTLPAIIAALNHLLYHGLMPTAEQTAILNYCGSISDPQLRMESAVFLALNGDSYLTVQ